MKKTAILIIIIFINISLFAQENNKKPLHSISIELSGGLFFSEYRYFKNYACPIISPIKN